MSLTKVVSLENESRLQSWLKEALIILGASILIALSAPISIPLPFSPVPIALSVHVILFVSAILGSKRGALAALAYLMQGALGLPVFAGGVGGLAVLLGPRGGYLVSYILVAWMAGFLLERTKEATLMKKVGSLALANLSVYPLGVLWLMPFVGSFKMALLLGFLPFIPGDCLKLVLVCKALPRPRT